MLVYYSLVWNWLTLELLLFIYKYHTENMRKAQEEMG